MCNVWAHNFFVIVCLYFKIKIISFSSEIILNNYMFRRKLVDHESWATSQIVVICMQTKLFFFRKPIIIVTQTNILYHCGVWWNENEFFDWIFVFGLFHYSLMVFGLWVKLICIQHLYTNNKKALSLYDFGFH